MVESQLKTGLDKNVPRVQRRVIRLPKAQAFEDESIRCRFTPDALIGLLRSGLAAQVEIVPPVNRKPWKSKKKFEKQPRKRAVLVAVEDVA